MGFVADAVEDIGGFVVDAVEDVGDVVTDGLEVVADGVEKGIDTVVNTVETIIEDPTKAIPIIITAVVAPELAIAMGTDTATAALIVNSGQQLASGADLEDIAESAIINIAGATVTSNLSTAIADNLPAGVDSSTSAAITTKVLTNLASGQDLTTSLTNAIGSTVSGTIINTATTEGKNLINNIISDTVTNSGDIGTDIEVTDNGSVVINDTTTEIETDGTNDVDGLTNTITTDTTTGTSGLSGDGGPPTFLEPVPTTFNDAFREARASGLDEFTWNGNRYTTELAPERTFDANATASDLAGFKSYNTQAGALQNAQVIDDRVYDEMGNVISGGVGIPDTALGRAVEKAQSGLGTVARAGMAIPSQALGEQAQFFSDVAAATGLVDRENSFYLAAKAMNDFGKDIMPAEIKASEQGLLNNVRNADGWAAKAGAFFTGAVENPLGAMSLVGQEIIQEALPLGLAKGVARFGSYALSLGTDVAANMAESFGAGYGDAYDNLIKRGYDPVEADKIAVVNGLESAAITMVTAGVGDAAMVQRIMGDVSKATTSGILKAGGKEYVSEYIESFVQDAATQYNTTGTVNWAQAQDAGSVGAGVGAKTSASILAGSNLATPSDVHSAVVEQLVDAGISRTDAIRIANAEIGSTIVEGLNDINPDLDIDATAVIAKNPITGEDITYADAYGSRATDTQLIDTSSGLFEDTLAALNLDTQINQILNTRSDSQASQFIYGNNGEVLVQNNDGSITVVSNPNNTDVITTTDPNTGITTTVDTNTNTGTVVDPNTGITTDVDVNTNTDTNVDTNVDTNTDTNIDTNINPNINVNTDTNIGTNTNTTPDTNVITNVNVPPISGYETTPISPDDRTPKTPQQQRRSGLGALAAAGNIAWSPTPRGPEAPWLRPTFAYTGQPGQDEHAMNELNPAISPLLQARETMGPSQFIPEMQQVLEQRGIVVPQQEDTSMNYYTYGSTKTPESILAPVTGPTEEQPLPTDNVSYLSPFGDLSSFLINPEQDQQYKEEPFSLTGTYKQGGLAGTSNHFVSGGKNSYVRGSGNGQDDKIPAMLSDGEYVIDADIVAALGDGSNEAGAKVLDKMREQIRKHKRSASKNDIPPAAKSPLEYMRSKK